jgi:hypothetical protein
MSSLPVCLTIFPHVLCVQEENEFAEMPESQTYDVSLVRTHVVLTRRVVKKLNIC